MKPLFILRGYAVGRLPFDDLLARTKHRMISVSNGIKRLVSSKQDGLGLLDSLALCLDRRVYLPPHP
jgi:hypothetical protein